MPPGALRAAWGSATFQVWVRFRQPVAGTVAVRLPIDSQVYEPEDRTITYLYWKVVPAGTLTVPFQTGYVAPERCAELIAVQLPSCGIEPTMYTSSPTFVPPTVAFTFTQSFVVPPPLPPPVSLPA
jgi:hypothetical protein